MPPSFRPGIEVGDVVADKAAMLAEARAVARQAHLFEGAEGETQIERGLPRGKERRALAGLGRSRCVIGHPLAPFGEDRREWAKDVGGERACSGSENGGRQKRPPYLEITSGAKMAESQCLGELLNKKDRQES